MECSICNFLKDALTAIEHQAAYPYPRTREHREGIEDLAIRHYKLYHPNPFTTEEEYMNPRY